jgi:hypothetical protein
MAHCTAYAQNHAAPLSTHAAPLNHNYSHPNSISVQHGSMAHGTAYARNHTAHHTTLLHCNTTYMHPLSTRCSTQPQSLTPQLHFRPTRQHSTWHCICTKPHCTPHHTAPLSTCCYTHYHDYSHPSFISRAGQNHIYTVYIQYFWQGDHQIYGHIRCIYTVLANPSFISHALAQNRNKHLYGPPQPSMIPHTQSNNPSRCTTSSFLTRVGQSHMVYTVLFALLLFIFN